jgi:hypothetical protein
MSSAAASAAREVMTNSAPGDIGEGNALVHDAGQLARAVAQLLLGFACEARVCRSAVDDEDASNRAAPELLADPVRLIEQFQGVGYSPEVERAWLDG